MGHEGNLPSPGSCLPSPFCACCHAFPETVLYSSSHARIIFVLLTCLSDTWSQNPEKEFSGKLAQGTLQSKFIVWGYKHNKTFGLPISKHQIASEMLKSSALNSEFASQQLSPLSPWTWVMSCPLLLSFVWVCFSWLWSWHCVTWDCNSWYAFLLTQYVVITFSLSFSPIFSISSFLWSFVNDDIYIEILWQSGLIYSKR